MMRRSICCLPALGLSALLLVPEALALPFDEARELVRRHMAEKNVPGLAVAVWQDGKVRWEEGFGWADVENRVPATEHTMFNLASLSKTMTATGVMTLAQAGKVDIDRPANDYLGPDRITVHVGDPREVTVRRIANHTSGLAAGDQFFYGDEAAALPTMSEVIRRYGVVLDAPGERYRYSNIGYGILGQLIEQVSGRRYEDFMRLEVFLPLGMTRSAMNVPPGLGKYQAVRYDYDRKPLPFYVSAEPASASIYSSAHDLARFGLFFLKSPQAGQRAILSEASIDRMMGDAIATQSSPVRTAGPDESGYAFGWVVSYHGGYRAFGHSGSTSGVNSELVLVPSQKMGFILLGNADGSVSSLKEPLMKILLRKWREPAQRVAEAGPASAVPAPELIGEWEGSVRTPEGDQSMKLTVLPGGDVHVSIGEPGRPGRSTLRQPALLNEVKFDGGVRGTTLAQIQTSDTRRHPHTVSLDLRLRDGVLCGSALAASVFDDRWIYALPHWAELRREGVVQEGAAQ